MYEVQWKNNAGEFETILMTQIYEMTFYLPQYTDSRTDLSELATINILLLLHNPLSAKPLSNVISDD